MTKQDEMLIHVFLDEWLEHGGDFKYIRADVVAEKEAELTEKAYRQGWRDNDELNNPEVGAPFRLPQSEDEGAVMFLAKYEQENQNDER